MWRNKISGNTEARDKAARFLANILIRQMQGISNSLNRRFNKLGKVKQLQLLWSSVIVSLILIVVSSVKFTMTDQTRMTGNYHPIAIGKPSVAAPVLPIQQLTDSLTHQTKKHEKD